MVTLPHVDKLILHIGTLLVGVALSSSATASTTSYVNVYWEKAGNTWNVDQAQVGAAAGTNPDGISSAQLTTDSIDSLLHTLTASDFLLELQTKWNFGAWMSTPIPSIVATACADPPATVAAASPGGSCIGHCGGADTGVAITAFVNCVVANYPQVTIANQTVIMNIWLPPWLGATNPTLDWCNVSGAGAVTAVVSGRLITFHPTNDYCANRTTLDVNLTSIMEQMSHELVEASAGNGGSGQGSYICDQCETEGLYYPFLSFLANTYIDISADFYNPGPVTCVPNATVVPNLNQPVMQACGAGPLMHLMATLDPRNSVPWDIANALPSYRGSFYVGANHVGPNWQAGFNHYDATNGSQVSLGSISWSVLNGNDFAFIKGFANGYGGSYRAPAGDHFNLQFFDQAYGQLSQVEVEAEGPNQLSSTVSVTSPVHYASPGAMLVSGNLKGSTSCGIPNYYTESGPQGPPPIGDSNLVIKVAGVQYATGTTDYEGDYSIVVNSPPAGTGQTVSVGAGPSSVSTTADIYPSTSSITPNVGPVGGLTPFQVAGSGWPTGAGQQVVFSGPLGNGQTAVANASATNASATSVSGNTPPSPLGGNKTGVVTVYVPVGGLWDSTASFTYEIPLTPLIVPQFGGFGNCNYNGSATYPFTVTIYDNNGSVQKSFAPIQLTTTAGIFCPNQLTTNGGTVSCLLTMAGGTITATYNGASSSISLPAAGFSCIDFSNLIFMYCGPGNPFCEPTFGFPADLPYTQQGDYWENPIDTDPFAVFMPTVVSVNSSYPVAITALGLQSIWRTQTLFDSSGDQLPIGPAVAPYSSAQGSHLQFTGSVVGIKLTQGGQSNWQVVLQFPMDSVVPPANYRVFGLNSAAGTWVEMNSTIVGQTIQATAQTTDPHGLVAGTVTGPYALVYYR